MAKKPNKGVVVSLRLTEEENASFDDARLRTGLNNSKLFRELLLNKEPVFKEYSQSKERLVFLFNKASNNLNQLSLRVNTAYRRGIVSERLYITVHNDLIAIRDLLLAGAEDAD